MEFSFAANAKKTLAAMKGLQNANRLENFPQAIRFKGDNLASDFAKPQNAQQGDVTSKFDEDFAMVDRLKILFLLMR